MSTMKNEKIVRVTNAAQRLFKDRMLVITPRDSMLQRFNEVGTAVWQILETPKTRDEICAEIKKRFDDVDDKKLTDDVDAFIEKLKEKKLVSLASIK